MIHVGVTVWTAVLFQDNAGTPSVFFKVWLEEPLSNFERPLIFFLLFLSVLSFVYTIVEADFERPLDNFGDRFGSSKRLKKNTGYTHVSSSMTIRSKKRSSSASILSKIAVDNSLLRLN